MLINSAAEFEDLVSGRRKGLRADMLRGVLRAAEIPYTWAVRRRNRRYDSGHGVIRPVTVPIVSVGNLTMGGTGKTPLVEWLARWYRQQGIRVALISRGYGAVDGPKNDEALELEERLQDVPHVQNPDRVAAAVMAVEEFECQLILLDDAFQHRRIARDLDVVLLDAQCPFGHGHVFPRGTLREPPGGLARADVVGLTRADQVSEVERQSVRRFVEQTAPGAAWLELAHVAKYLWRAGGTEERLDSLVGRRVAAFCGIGNPAAFGRTLADCGYEVAGWRTFADHHNYSRGDVEDISRWAANVRAEAVLCTHKDLVKLQTRRLGNVPLFAVVIGLEIREGLEALEIKLREILARCPP